MSDPSRSQEDPKKGPDVENIIKLHDQGHSAEHVAETLKQNLQFVNGVIHGYEEKKLRDALYTNNKGKGNLDLELKKARILQQASSYYRGSYLYTEGTFKLGSEIQPDLELVKTALHEILPLKNDPIVIYEKLWVDDRFSSTWHFEVIYKLSYTESMTRITPKKNSKA